ncbi:MAG: SulP family inorganic anion transporter [Burkholderiaceae bacterium]|nr:SulP family inorganic anion transporter [Burkholderiaceae bacterium]
MSQSIQLHRLFPFLTWPRPTLALLQGELTAGITVGLMMIPQCVAYAAVAGMPLVTGIYAALLPALVATLWSASSRLSVGPTALTALMVGSALAELAQPGSAEWVNLAVWLALLVGALQMALGFARFGWLLNVISAPVLMGFTQAAALLILTSQLPALLGFKGSFGELLTQTWRYASNLGQTALPLLHSGSALFGLVSLVFLLLAKRFVPRLPAVVVLMFAASFISYSLGFEAAGGSVVGTLPAGLPSLFVPTLLPLEAYGQLLLPVLVITLVSFIETASSAKVESQQGGQLWNQNQDLIGQGLAKIASGLSGSFPTSSSFSRSALNLYAGAKTGWANVAGVLVVMLALLFLTPMLHHVPQSVLAAVVVAAIYSLIVPSRFLRLWRVSKMETVSALATFVTTALSAPRLYWGIITGMLMGLGHFLYLRLHPRIIEVGLHADGSLRDRHLWQLPPLAPQLYALRMDAELDFASASEFERAIMQQLVKQPDIKHICLFAQPINRVDATGLETFGQVRRMLFDRGITLHISGIKLPVERILIGAGELPKEPGAWPLLRLYRTDAEALAACKAQSEVLLDGSAYI